MASPADNQVYLQIFKGNYAQGKGPAASEAMLRSLNVDDQTIAAVRRQWEEEIGKVRKLNQRAIKSAKIRPNNWYLPSPDDIFWPNLRDVLAKDLPEDAVEQISNYATKITDFLSPPGHSDGDNRGLVLGYVQSGKTTSFMSVMAKAADGGYRLIVVLSGITDNLRSQTQARLEQNLVENGNEQHWHLLTTLDSDFTSSANSKSLLGTETNRLIAVVKKNPHRLRKLRNWIKSAGALADRCPILIIDDEADQASINVSNKARASTINALIREILNNKKSTYVAYSATPFANVLISPTNKDDLYPRDFVVSLPASESYFGPEKIFGRSLLEGEDGDEPVGMDILRIVRDDEISAVRPPSGKGAVSAWEPSLEPSLRESIDWFIVASAVRLARSGKAQHSTMLIHTSMNTEAHDKLKSLVARYLSQTKAGMSTNVLQKSQALQALWDREKASVPVDKYGTFLPEWREIWPHVLDVVQATRVITDNYRSTDRLTYPTDDPQYTIVIGGNTLSRGLTLEGLVSSYFVRNARAYDTLLQMGRWFGYRRGYEDLPRIWMPTNVMSWFADLATVEEDLRSDIRRYELESATPDQIRPKIRLHRAMEITSRAKARSAIKVVASFSDSRPQTILFNHTDKNWLDSNIEAVRSMTKEIRSANGAAADGLNSGRIVFRNVPSKTVLHFIDNYSFQESATSIRGELLSKYVSEQNGKEALLEWNVVLLGAGTDTGQPELDLGAGHSLRTIQRTRVLMSDMTHANIKALSSRTDFIEDLDADSDAVKERLKRIRKDAKNDTAILDREYRKLRSDFNFRTPSLYIYPIDKDSIPRNWDPDAEQKLNQRVPLQAAQHVIGVAFCFPEAESDSSIEYMAASLDADIGVDEDSDNDAPSIDDLDQADAASDSEDENA